MKQKKSSSKTSSCCLQLPLLAFCVLMFRRTSPGKLKGYGAQLRIIYPHRQSFVHFVSHTFNRIHVAVFDRLLRGNASHGRSKIAEFLRTPFQARLLAFPTRISADIEWTGGQLDRLTNPIECQCSE